MKERNIGGAIHDLVSTGVLKEGATILNTTQPVG